MKNSLKPLAIALLLCMAFTSCRKKDKLEVASPQLVKIEQDGANYLSMNYNADRTLSKITSVEDNYTQETLITYDSQQRPVLGNAGTHHLKFVYENGKLKRINTVMAENQQLVGFLEFTYANDRLAQTLVSANINGQVIGETKLIYDYYPNGDVKQTTVVGLDPEDHTFSVYSIHRFEYDQLINPLLSASPFFSNYDWNPSSHNITKEVVLSPTEVVQETITTTYTYDAKTRMPLTATQKTQPVNGDASTVTKKFIYN